MIIQHIYFFILIELPVEKKALSLALYINIKEKYIKNIYMQFYILIVVYVTIQFQTRQCFILYILNILFTAQLNVEYYVKVSVRKILISILFLFNLCHINDTVLGIACRYNITKTFFYPFSTDCLEGRKVNIKCLQFTFIVFKRFSQNQLFSLVALKKALTYRIDFLAFVS